MTSTDAPLRAAGRNINSAPAGVVIGAALALGLLAVLGARISSVVFVLCVAGLLSLLGVATVRWPRAMLVVVVLSPALIDLYAGQRILPDAAQNIARLFSETLLLVMALVLLVRAARQQTLVSAIRHPVSLALTVFALISLVSMFVNAVPIQVAAAGMLFTLDAVVLFYLPRMVGFTNDQAHDVLFAIAVVIAFTALLAVGQAVLSPDLLGLTPVVGRSGEGARLGSLVGDPNILGTMIGMALPFTLYALVRASSGRRRQLLAGMAFVMMLALLLTYSRGSWNGFVVAFGGIALLIDRRTLLTGIAVLALAYGTAVVMPKGLLGGGVSGFDPFATTINRFNAVRDHRDLRTLFVVNAFPIVRDHPSLGVGPGRYGGAAASIFGSPVYIQYGTEDLLTEQHTVDNFWLHMSVEGGVLGVSAFLAIIGIALLGPVRALRRSAGSRFAVLAGIISATVAVCVATVTTMLLEGNTVAFLFWFLLGLASLYAPLTSKTGGPAGSATPSAG